MIPTEEVIMARKSLRAPMALDEAASAALNQIVKSRTAAVRQVERARVLLAYAAGDSVSAAAKAGGVTRMTAYKCIDKGLAMGWEAALKDTYHTPRKPTITLAAKAWVVAIACTKPTEHGKAAEMWTLQALATFARQAGVAAGHACLARAAKATIQRIISEHPIQPHKVTYYLEKRDPEFDRKMEEVLVVYKEVNLQNAAEQPGPPAGLFTVCVDEKPGIQALARTAPDLPPVPGEYPTTARDYEYKRLGTASILAGIDLHTGHIFATVERRHRSCEFIALLALIDAFYPVGAQIRLILDNHSAHISKETRAWLAKHPNRFIYVHTPKHGSWLNLAECLFSKMTRAFLRNIRVKSWDELKSRILLGVREMNEAPVVFKWHKFDFAKN
jgi:transposase